MKDFFRLILITLCCNIALSQSAGFNSTYLILDINNSGAVYYDLNATTANADLNGIDFGTINNLVIKGFEHNVWKCNGADIYGTNLYYQINSGSITSLNSSYISGSSNGCGGADQQWGLSNGSTNILNGLSPGNYTLTVFGNFNSSIGDVWDNNSGSNYVATFTVPSQTITSFSTGEGFSDGALYNQSGWDSSFTGTTWMVDTSIGAITLSNDWQRAAWEQGFSVSGAGESITFRVDLKFIGTFGTNNNPLIKIGFSSSSDVASSTPPANVVFLRTASYNTQLQLGNNVNSGPLSPNASLVIADCQASGESDDLAVFVTLTLGADAGSSTISSKLMNLTDGTETVIGSYTGINSSVYSAATTNIYGFLHAQSLTTTGNNAITQVQVSSVTMTQGDYLYSVVNQNGGSTSSSTNRINNYGQIGSGNLFVTKNGKIISY